MVHRTRFVPIIATLFVLAANNAHAQSPFGPPIADYGGATLKPRPLQNVSDYPEDALRRIEEGRVVATYQINEKGRVTDCAITQSSGFKSLDTIVCPLIKRRARYEPAKDANGTPIVTTGRSSMDFWIPRMP